VWENAPINGVGPRVEEGANGLVTSYPYTAPFEDLRLKEKR
jgi:peptide/nickel transport system substrate-binding protein